MTSEVKNGLAIPLALVGNAINSVGYILQKQAHMNNEIKKDKWIEEQMRKGRKGVIDINGSHVSVPNRSPPCSPNSTSTTTSDERKYLEESYPDVSCCCGNQLPMNHFLLTPLWWIGILLYGVGSAVHGMALSYGSHTIIAPMDAFTLVCNAIFAPLILKEVFTIPQVVGTMILILGIAGIAISAPKDPPDFESGKCFDMVAQSKCLASLFGWGGATLFMYLARRIRADERQEKDTSKAKGVFEMLIICFLCAFFGSICQLSLKCFFSQLAFVPEVLTEGTNFYMITFCFVCSMLLLEVWRQRALKNFDALFVVPIICALLLSGSVVLGGVCFNEFEVISSSEAGILGVSVGLCMVGVMGISYQPGEEVEKFKERTESMKFVGKGDVDDNQL